LPEKRFTLRRRRYIRTKLREVHSSRIKPGTAGAAVASERKYTVWQGQ